MELVYEIRSLNILQIAAHYNNSFFGYLAKKNLNMDDMVINQQLWVAGIIVHIWAMESINLAVNHFSRREYSDSALVKGILLWARH